jgi:hypothetical protein
MTGEHLGVLTAVVFRLVAAAAVIGSIIASIGRLRKKR